MARGPRAPTATPFRRDTFGSEILDHAAIAVDDGHPLSNAREDRRQFFLIGHTADRQRRTNLSGASGASDPVNIGLNRIRQVEIHHHAKAGHINAARRHIGGDKNLKLAGFEFAKHLDPDRLSHVTMQHVGIQPLLAKPVSKLLGADSCPRKDKHLSAIELLELLQQHIALVHSLDQHRRLFNGVHRLAGPCRTDGHRILEEGFSKCLHLLRHRRREEYRLAGRGQCLENAFDRRIEAEIDHLVAFVEDKMLDIVELDLATGLKVLETARRGHDHINAFIQRPDLEVIALAAADGNVADLEAAGESLDAVRNLIGELSRRGEDQHACPAHIVGLALVEQLVQKRQQIGRRLTGAGLRQADEIMSGKNGRNGLLLDRGRLGQALRRDVVDDARRETKFKKRIARKIAAFFRHLLSGFDRNGGLIGLGGGCGLDGHGHPSRERTAASRDTAAAIYHRLPELRSVLKISLRRR